MLDVQDWRGDLVALLEASEGRDPAEIVKCIHDLAADMGDGVAEALLDSNPELFDHAPALTRANYRRILDNEGVETQQLLAQSREGPVRFADVAGTTALAIYNRISGMFDRVDFGGCRRFVVVGCGPLPATVFHVHDRTDVPEIVGLDVRPEAVETAGELARRLGYARASFAASDGASYDYGGADIVFVANMVFGKKSILSRIADTAPQDVRLILRDSYSLGRLYAENAVRDLDPRLEVVGEGEKDRSVALSYDVYLKLRARAGSGR
jgi:hypothetical protein